MAVTDFFVTSTIDGTGGADVVGITMSTADPAIYDVIDLPATPCPPVSGPPTTGQLWPRSNW